MEENHVCRGKSETACVLVVSIAIRAQLVYNSEREARQTFAQQRCFQDRIESRRPAEQKQLNIRHPC